MAAPRRLDFVTIHRPCPASWEAMEPVPGGRHCTLCERRVHDLSALTRSEAEALLGDRSGGLCVRIVRDADGRVVTRRAGESRPPAGALARLGRRLLGAVSLLAAACGAGERTPAAAAKPGEPAAAVAPPAASADSLSEQERQLLASLGYVEDAEAVRVEETLPGGPTEEQRRLRVQLGGTPYVPEDAETPLEPRAPSERCPKDR
jgi:hypothetical protein